MAALPLLFTIGSAVIGAVGAIQQGKATAAAANHNAQVAEQNAKTAREMAQADVEAKARDQQRHFGAMRAAYGANGLAFEGSALDVFEDQLYDAELDKRLISYKGELRARGYEEEAVNKRMEASAAKSAGFIGALSAGFKAGSSYFSTDKLSAA